MRATVIAERRRSSIVTRNAERVVEEAAKAERRKRQAQHLSSKYPKRTVLTLKQIFDEYDRDGNGWIDRKELHAALAKQKKEMQRFDGRALTLAERQARAGWVPGQGALDSVGDGVFLVDQSESMFQTLDLNGDSRVEFGELLKTVFPLATEAERQTMLTWVSDDPPPDSDEEMTEEEQRRVAAKTVEMRKMFAAFDSNRDGLISLKEFKAGLSSGGWDDQMLEEIFADTDTSNDGCIDFDEWLVLMADTHLWD